MPQRYEIQVLINAKDNASQALSSLKKGFASSLSIPTSFSDVAQMAGRSLAGLIDKAGQFVTEGVQMAIQAEAAQKKFQAFAGGAAQAEEYLTAFTTATDGAVSKMAAMQGAGKLLQMGIVSNAEEMGKLAAIATKLGDQTATAGDRINDFAQLLANQSAQRLDNFGISSGRVRTRIEELIKTGQAANREQAFKLAVMEEGAKSLAKLGDTGDLTTTKIAKVQAAMEDAKLETGQAIMAMAADIDILGLNLGNLSDRIRGLPDSLGQLGAMAKAAAEGYGYLLTHWFRFGEAINVFEDAMRRAAIAMMPDTTPEEERFRQYNKGIKSATQSNIDYAESVTYTGKTQDQLMSIILTTNREIVASENAKAREIIGTDQDIADKILAANAEIVKGEWETSNEAARAARAANIARREYLLDQTMAFTQYFRDEADQTQKYTDEREKVEAEHQNKLAGIRAAGQGRATEIDREAEQAKLEILESCLTIALQQQAEFNDKTKESQRLSKELQISRLRGQIAEQKTLLSGAAKATTTENATKNATLIAQENARYAKELALLETEMEKQKEMQRLKLGEMVLQNFEAWATMKQIPADKMIEMRTAIATEYGLIDKATAAVVLNMTQGWEDWATDYGESASSVVRKVDEQIAAMNDLADRINTIPDRTVTITTRYITAGAPDEGSQAGGPEVVPPGTPTPGEGWGGVTPGAYQHGTGWARPGWARVGEYGAEMVYMRGGERVVPNQITNNFTMNVHTRAAQASVVQDFNVMKSMLAA